MAESRIRIAKDKAELVRALRDGSDVNGPFKTYADVVAFAAALGAQRGVRTPFQEVSDNPEPIPQEIFTSRKYNKLTQLLAVIENQDPKVLADTDDAEQGRTKIFEEFANTGLEEIKKDFSGSIDYLEQLLLFLLNPKNSHKKSNTDFDLSRFL